MKLNVAEGPEITILARTLNVPRYSAVGLVELLVQHGHRVADREPINPAFRRDHVEVVCSWDGDGGALVSALLDTDLLADCGDGRVEIARYWDLHAESFVRSRANMRQKRETEKSRRQRRNDGTTTKTIPNTDTKDEDEYEYEYEYGGAQQLETVSNTPEESASADACASFTEPKDGEDYGALLAGNQVNPTLAARAHAVSGDGPEYRNWWSEVERRMLDDGGYGELLEAIGYAEDCQNPALRKMKDLGELKAPGRYIADACKRFGITLPPPPGRGYAHAN